MNIIGKWKVAKVGVFDIEEGLQMKTIEQVMAMEETEDIQETKEMAQATFLWVTAKTMQLRAIVPPEAIEEAKEAGEEIPLNKDGSVTIQRMPWKEEDGKILCKMGDQGENVYREYMYIEGKWEIVGDSNIDFSNYYTKGEVDTKIGSYYTKGEVDAALADYALTTYVDAQDGSTLTSANAYADAAVSTASSALNDSITAVDGKFASYYDKDTVDATFAPIDGATLTNVVSITGDAAHVAVSKVTATEL